MNKRFTVSALTALVCLLTTRPDVMAAEAYAVDPDHTSIVFSVGHAGFSYIYGFFRKAQGNFVLDKTNPANCRFRFTIDANSLDTNQARRDEHLKSAEFFEVQQYPTIQFDSTSCALAKTADGSIVYQVTGNMTLHGVTQRVTIPLRMLGEGKSPFNDYRVGFLSNFQLKRSDYKMDKWPEMVGDAIAITISFEGILQDAAGNPARAQ
jgi:polyisoprenoid-binding protein YceI